MKLILEHLDCAHCAAKIEAKVNEMDGISAAKLNFMQKTLHLWLDRDAEEEEVFEKVCHLMAKMEPDVVVSRGEKTVLSRVQIDWKEASMALGALVLALVGLLFSEPVRIIFFAAAYLLIGWKVLLHAGKNLISGKVFDENFLMAIATLGAFAIGEYLEAIAVMLFYRAGETLERYALNRSRKSIRALLDICPERATVVRGIEIKTVAPEEVAVGDVILIKPGERVPLDAKVLEGSSELDTSALTGESLPRVVEKGDMLLSGCVNLSGVLHARVVKCYEESTVSTILNLMESASERKSKSEAFIGKFARVYTPIVVGLAVVVALLPPLVFSADWSAWIYRALLFLMISCPCALVLSIPLTYFCGLGSASKQGILIKGSQYISALAKADTVVFDKTGTLTEGVFSISEIVSEQISREDLLMLAAHIECQSNHPIAKSVCAAYGKAVDHARIGEVKELPGYGICAKIDGRTAVAGSAALMQRLEIRSDLEDAESAIIHLALEQTYLGYIKLSDQVKNDSAQAILALKELGVQKTVMLTGDRATAAVPIGQNLGIDEIRAELLPDQKVEELERLCAQAEGALVYVGDGINDAPSIARADVGVAMGAIGADAAIQAADVVVMTDEPQKLVTAIEIARKTEKIVCQNTVFTLAVKLLVMILGVFGFANLWQAVFADVGVSLIAVFNSSRAFKK